MTCIGIFLGKSIFLEKEDDPRPLHMGDACGNFIDYSREPYKVEQQYAWIRHLSNICRYSYPNDEGVQAGPHTQTSHLSYLKPEAPTKPSAGSGAQTGPTHSHLSSPPSSTGPSSEQLSDCNWGLVSLVVPTNQGFSTKLIGIRYSSLFVLPP